MKKNTKPQNSPTDRILPFYLQKTNIHGRFIELQQSFNTIIGQHLYPYPVAYALAECLLLATSLSSVLKYQGVFTLQIKGSGPIKLMVVDCTEQGHLRGYAQFEENRLPMEKPNDFLSVPQLFGQGYLAFTVDQGPDTERYQGIVELIGLTLTECVQQYFRQSEQINTTLFMGIEKNAAGWRGKLLMLQQLPSPASSHAIYQQKEHTEQWEEMLLYLSTLKRAEILNPKTTSEQLLHLLFHEQSLHIHEARPLLAQCRCSETRVRQVLQSFPLPELKTLQIDGIIEVHCEFCNRQYSFSEKDLAL